MTSMQILQTLLEITLYSAVLFACIMAFKTITKGKLSPTLSFVLWFLLIIRLCVPFTIQSAVHLFTLPQEQKQIVPNAPSAETLPQDITASHQNESLQYTRAQFSTGQTQEAEPASDAQQPFFPSLNLYDWIVIAWLAGVCAFSAWTAGLSMRISRVIRQQSVRAPAHIEKIYESCRRELGIKKRPPLLVTQNLFSPALVASPRPAILLPFTFATRAEEEQIRLALRHELVHYKHRDHWLCMLLRILSVVYWFNPVLWLAEKEISADMETACDNRIVRGMQKDEKAYYANTILSMFSARAETPFIIGLALPNTRRIAEKRIRGIYSKNKTKRSIKLAAVLLSCVLLVSCFTTACQPAQAVSASPSPTDTQATQAIASATPVAAQTPAPTPTPDNRYKDTKKLNDIVTVNYNADVVQPDKVPVASVQIRDFTEADVQKVVDYFFAGQPIYTPWKRTKTDIQKEIESYQQANTAMDAAREKYISEHPWAADLYQTMLKSNGGLTGDAWNKVKEQYSITDADQEAFMYACGRISSTKQYNYEIKKDQEEFKTAPDTAEKKPAVVKFQDVNMGNVAGVESGVEQYMDHDMIMNQCKVWSERPDGTVSEVFGARRDKGQNSSIMYGREVSISQVPFELVTYPPLTISQEEAQKLAEQAISAICPDLTLAGSSIGYNVEISETGEQKQTKGYYEFSFSRKVADVPITFDNRSSAFNYEVGNDLKSICYEEISVGVDDNGIHWLEWCAPYANIQIADQNAKVISMQEAEQKFEQNTLSVLIKKGYTASKEKNGLALDSIQINVTRVQLGLTRIMDKEGDFTLVPTWDFFGTAQATRNGEEQKSNRFGQGRDNESLGTVNALDGTEVDRSGPAMNNW